ncbi:MAG: cytochrome c biogenesis protein CcsA [Bacteroidetes bacterium]|nr:cytochrome c biogenesis protein CcsA [Bacteroidota bacterium]
MDTTIQYIGEELFWGKLGNMLIILAFTSALFSSFSYIFALRTGEDSWRKIARKSFLVHTISIIGIFGVIMSLIVRHRFEYFFIWEHSNKVMPMRYILSCMWEGQEGSFLLWMFWNTVLSWVVIYKSREWESGVMINVSLVQSFLGSMLLGVVIFNHKIGNNPFILLREAPDFANLPFVQMPDYLSKLADGRGLNPLLQNYWMTIHPPTLFLGFASTVVPFAFAMAGLMRKKYTEWIEVALPYTFFSVMILGTGILMGAAWAYEALSFGGFWAWDPVENASLVPWMTLVGAAHVMLIYKARKHSLLSAYLLSIATFILVLYSTFLTRSGILGDTSVHAFTDLGMTGHLVFYILFFLALAAWFLVKNRKSIIIQHEDEKLSSREFWMFIGSLVLLIGCIQITITTSIPVINKLFGLKMAPPVDAIDHYNRWQVPVAIIICLLIGIGQFFKYKQSDSITVRKRLLIPFSLSILVTVGCAFILKVYPPQYYALFFASVFAFIANMDYMFRILKGKISFSGASIAHAGIALILLGALISNSKKQVISQNMKMVDLGKDFPNNENIMVEQRTDTLPMGEYWVVYKGKELVGVNTLYTIEYYNLNRSTGIKEKQFELKPIIQINARMGNVAEPATKHFLSKDIYTHLTYYVPEDKEGASGDWQAPKTHTVSVGDTFMLSNSMVIVQGLNKNIDKNALQLTDADIAVGAQLLIEDINKNTYNAEPLFIIHDMQVYSKEALVDTLGVKFSFGKIDPATGKLDLAVAEKKANKKEFIIMKAIIFPGINILWMGCILMILGSFIAIRQRIKSATTKPVS